MQVRVTWRVEAFIEGDTLEECKEKFNAGDNLENDFVELVSVEDAETFEDYLEDWEEL